MKELNELDCVRLTEDFEDLKRGTEGAIVLKYNESYFEVEFFDENCRNPVKLKELMEKMKNLSDRQLAAIELLVDTMLEPR